MSLVRDLPFKTNANISRSDWSSRQVYPESRLQDAEKGPQIPTNVSTGPAVGSCYITAIMKVHESTVEKRLHKFNFPARHVRGEPFLSIKRNITASLILALEKKE